MEEKRDAHVVGVDDGYNSPSSGQRAIRPQERKLYDSAVTFEEYHYYALKTRDFEKNLTSPGMNWGLLLGRKPKHNPADIDSGPTQDHINANLAKEENRLAISDEEWVNASRAFRTAGWGAIFYLITTDILGPFAVPFSIGTLGFGPGIALFTVFGFFAGYSGYLIWHVFMGVDSYEFPARNYGDLAFRAWGSTARHAVNLIQSLALLLLLGQVIILFGGNIFEMSKEKLCYVVCPVIYTIVGFLISQIRTLKNFGWLATFSIWLNVLTIFITMGIIAHSKPNYAEVAGSVGADVGKFITPHHGVYPKIKFFYGLPTTNLVGSINGLNSAVLAYAGAQLFVEFLAEMKRPRDFLKAMWGAQIFIFVLYVVYGCFVYYYQGQYTVQPSFQGVSSYGWQTAGNTLTLISGLIAGGLYGNIGVKVFYNNIICELFGAPLISSRGGKIFYAIIVPIWWSVAFLVAAAIPAYFLFVSLIAASTLLNLTYTIPPWIALGFAMKKNSMLKENGDGFDPHTGEVKRTGTYIARHMRGFLAGGPIRVFQNSWNVLYVLCSLGMCGLGMWAAIVGMIIAFENPQETSYSCNAPAIP